MLEEEKVAKREYGRNRYRNMTDDEKNSKRIPKTYQAVKKIKYFFLYNVKMSKKTLKFGDPEVNKK